MAPKVKVLAAQSPEPLMEGENQLPKASLTLIRHGIHEPTPTRTYRGNNELFKKYKSIPTSL